MNSHDLAYIINWFNLYGDSFSTPVIEDQRNITLKQVHSEHVRKNALRIAQDLGLNSEATALAEAAGLLHDVGRFEQYRQYKTFHDSVSINHGTLGAQVLREQGVLGVLSEHDREMIIRCVSLHNVFIIPSGVDAESLHYVRLVRDADKLDILRVFLDYYNQDEATRAGAVALGLPDTPGYSSEVLSSLMHGNMVKMSQLRTLNDFKLLQLAWLYDLNFKSSFAMVIERDYIRHLSAHLPQTPDIFQAIAILNEYVEKALCKP